VTHSQKDMSVTTSPAKPHTENIGRSAFLVAAGIFMSRTFGLVRESVFAYFFGLSPAADAFRAALRIPNILQNLFGEGVLSASFIPVYARLLAQGAEEEADRVAGAVFSLLALVTSVLMLVGVLATPWLIDLIAPGFHDARRPLAIHLVRIVFPGVWLLVLSAWCLGILNSHRRFFLPYVAAVMWNLGIIGALVAFGGRSGVGLDQLAIYAMWGSVVGSALQFLVQLPMVLRMAPRLRFAFIPVIENVRVVIRNFVPVFISRGVVQVSAYVDAVLASFLPASALAAVANAYTIYLLPVSLFGMSISVAELPAMSSALGSEHEIADTLRRRINASTRRIAFFAVPSAMAFLALGQVVVGAVFQRGRFTLDDTYYVWGILAGSAVGLVAATVARLYSSAYYALRDTRTPLRYAIFRVTLTTVLGCACTLPWGNPLVPRLLGIEPRWGAAGLTVSYGIAAWLEFLLLRRGMSKKIGKIDSPVAYFGRLWTAAVLAAALAWGIKLLLHPQRPLLAAVEVLLPYGVAYLLLTVALGIDEARALQRRLTAMWL
jgi:putative peptidoglycan lipid II flippase